MYMLPVLTMRAQYPSCYSGVMTALHGVLRVVGRVLREVPKGVFLEVLAQKGGIHGAIP